MCKKKNKSKNSKTLEEILGIQPESGLFESEAVTRVYRAEIPPLPQPPTLPPPSSTSSPTGKKLLHFYCNYCNFIAYFYCNYYIFCYIIAFVYCNFFSIAFTAILLQLLHFYYNFIAIIAYFYCSYYILILQLLHSFIAIIYFYCIFIEIIAFLLQLFIFIVFIEFLLQLLYFYWIFFSSFMWGRRWPRGQKQQ